MQVFIHYSFHFIFPLIIAVILFKKNWKKTYCIFIATMLVDLDHLLTNPIFDPNRCSINFHPLHTYYAIAIYILLLFLRNPLRTIGIGRLLHMLADLIDCIMMYKNCSSCFYNSPALKLLENISRIIGS